MGASLSWYGATLAWWAPLEREARHRFGPTLQYEYGIAWSPCRWCPDTETLTYAIEGLDVIGDPDPVTMTIRFYDKPPYDTFGLPAEDFPRVFAKPGATSKHRYPIEDALCLWHPKDPPDRRWTSSKGLLDLIEIGRQHLFLENHWRETGGPDGGEWLLPDAPHGLDGPK